MAKRLSIKPLPKDHPIYKLGFVIGGKTSSHFTKNTQGNDSNNESQKSCEEESKEDTK